MTLKSGFWYEIIYSSKDRVFFQFLDTTEIGQLRCRLCDGSETTTIFRGQYMEVHDLGENKPC